MVHDAYRRADELARKVLVAAGLESELTGDANGEWLEHPVIPDIVLDDSLGGVEAIRRVMSECGLGEDDVSRVLEVVGRVELIASSGTSKSLDWRRECEAVARVRGWQAPSASDADAEQWLESIGRPPGRGFAVRDELEPWALLLYESAVVASRSMPNEMEWILFPLAV